MILTGTIFSPLYFKFNTVAMDKNKNQGQVNPEKGKSGQESVNQGKRNEPVDNNPTGGGSAQQQSQSGSQQSAEWKRPLTNQDEQQETTNADKSDDSAIGEEESEGDERLKPYKNIGDDSEETEKKTPTME